MATAAATTAGSTSGSTITRTPVAELARLRAIGRLLTERPEVADLVPIDDDLAAELRRLLTGVGWEPGRSDATAAALRGAARAAARVGTPRAAPAGWTPEWDEALTTWMEIANLEERIAAVGWIDPVVVSELRSASRE